MSQIPISQGLKRKASTQMVKRAKTGDALTTAQRSAVGKIARSAARSLAETKSYIASHSQPLVNDVAYVQNLFGQITQGDASTNVTGEKIWMKNVHIRMKLQQINSTAATNQSSTFRVSVVASKLKLTSTVSSITHDDIFRGSAVDLANRGFIDLSKGDVLFDQTYHVPQPNISDVPQHTNMVLNLKLNKPATFESDNSAYFKDKTLYLVYTNCKTDAGIAVNTGYAVYQWTANFKDA